MRDVGCHQGLVGGDAAFHTFLGELICSQTVVALTQESPSLILHPLALGTGQESGRCQRTPRGVRLRPGVWGRLP